MNETNNFTSEAERQFFRLYNKAFNYQAKNQQQQAISHYQQALEYNPEHLATLQVLGYLVQQSGDLNLAIRYYQRALDQHPHSHALQMAIADCYEAVNELDKALLHYEQAIKLRQDSAVALNNYGNVCRKLGLIKESEEALLNALRLNITVETLANLGLLMYEKRQYSLAESFYDHALRLEPDNLKIKWNKALLSLSQKKFSEGWELYDSGLLAGTRPKQISPLLKNNETYSSDFFRNKIVYVHSEQGIGDEIMFASCINEIIDLANLCIIECDDRLAPLFQRSFKNAQIIAKSETLFNTINKSLPQADIYISSASIPRFMRPTENSFPVQEKYLQAYPRAIQLWQRRYEKLGKGLKIGISWQGGSKEETRKRSNTLALWNKILSTPDCKFINLQYGDVESQLEQANKPVHEWPDTDHFHNIEQLAAQIASLDLVITVSNVTAHLAGALGVPTWVMLPYSPNWRWFEGNNPSLWYKNARLFRQQSHGDWQSVINAVESELLQLLSQQKPKQKTTHVVL